MLCVVGKNCIDIGCAEIRKFFAVVFTAIHVRDLGSRTGTECRCPSAVLSSEVLVIGYVDHIRRPQIGHALLGAVEALLEQP